MNTSSTPVRSNVANLLLQMKGNENILETIPETPVKTNDNDINSGCNCKKSRCLKLYCACFAAKTVCISTCNCVSCANTSNNLNERQEAMKLILERNPSAFDSKFKIEATTVHKIGCHCRKSQCLKKYCECFHAGVVCNAICTCIQCANDGSGRQPNTTNKNKTNVESSGEKEIPIPSLLSPQDNEESIHMAAKALLSAKVEGTNNINNNNNNNNSLSTMTHGIIIQSQNLPSFSYRNHDDTNLLRDEKTSDEFYLQKRKREYDDQDMNDNLKENDQQEFHNNNNNNNNNLENNIPSNLERPSILGRKNVRFSSPIGNSPNLSYKFISGRIASPNSYLCASALSQLSRRGVSPKSLKNENENYSSTLMTDRMKSTTSTITSSPINSKFTPITPRSVNTIPPTPDIKPLPSVNLLTSSSSTSAPLSSTSTSSSSSSLSYSTSKPLSTLSSVDTTTTSLLLSLSSLTSTSTSQNLENNHNIQESPFKCKSAIHLLPESITMDYLNYGFTGISQITLPLCLLSNDVNNWTRPVVDVQGLISKNSDSLSIN